MKKYGLVVFIIIDITIAIVTFIIDAPNILGVNQLSMYSLYLSIYLLLTLLPLKKGNGMFFAFLSLYCTILFGRVILQYGFYFIPSTTTFDSIGQYAPYIINQGILLAIYSALGIHIGALVSMLKGKKEDAKEDTSEDIFKINALKVSSIIVFLIALFPAMINYYEQFQTGSNIDSQDTQTIISLLSGLMFPAIIMAMLSYRKSWVYIAGVLYYFPQFLWGGRGQPTVRIIILSYLFFVNVKNIKLKWDKVLAFGIVSLFMLNFFVVIKEVRNYPISSWFRELPTLFVDAFTKANPVLEVVYEVGVAMAPTVAAVEYIPQTIPLQYGKTIFYSLTTAIPDYFGLRPDIMSRFGNVGSLIASYAGASFGASILQDFYINFLWYTPLVMVFIGFLIHKLSLKVAFERNTIRATFWAMLVHPILWWPRSTLGYMFRNLAVTILVPLFIYYIFQGYYRRRGRAYAKQ